jgi:UPF0716 protein FxsA
MPILVLLFIVVPIVELYVIIQVGQWIGVLPTLAILVADALLGSFLLRQQGRSAWQRFNAALAERRFPGREVADGVMIVAGGTLLLTPGFITDIFGLLLLIPPSRALIRRVMFRIIGGRFALVGGIAGAARDRRRAGPSPADRPYDVEGEAREVPSDRGAVEAPPAPSDPSPAERPPDGPDQPRLPPS